VSGSHASQPLPPEDDELLLVLLELVDEELVLVELELDVELDELELVCPEEVLEEELEVVAPAPPAPAVNSDPPQAASNRHPAVPIVARMAMGKRSCQLEGRSAKPRSRRSPAYRRDPVR
jgi:hypothetical protein